MRNENIRLIKDQQFLYIVSFIFYVIACFLPLYKEVDFRGIHGLLYGWAGIMGDFNVFIPWLSNLFYFIAFFLIKRKGKAGLWFSVLAIMFGLVAFRIKEVLMSEGGATEKVSIGGAIYFWIASFLFMLVYHIAKNGRQR